MKVNRLRPIPRLAKRTEKKNRTDETRAFGGTPHTGSLTAQEAGSSRLMAAKGTFPSLRGCVGKRSRVARAFFSLTLRCCTCMRAAVSQCQFYERNRVNIPENPRERVIERMKVFSGSTWSLFLGNSKQVLRKKSRDCVSLSPGNHSSQIGMRCDLVLFSPSPSTSDCSPNSSKLSIFRELVQSVSD